jgi:Zn-dependent protease with chaperone function
MSLTIRAAVAILLMIGFYIFALGIAAGLFWIAYADFTYRDRVDRIEIVCVIAAVVILWSILPRTDRFEAPGPRINASQQPRLFAEISNIASAVGQEMPHDVYLVPEVNAWVAQRGGVAGRGSRRVMALGVPLMALLTVSQLRAVLAHEFGHYHAGDTKLTPWVYKTRIAIVRTVQNLARSRSYLALLSYPFKWYAEMFLRITLAVSRAQEYAADQLAARFAGSQALIDGLKQLHCGAAAWMNYLGAVVAPVLSAGYMPPLSSGLAQFIAAPNIRRQVEASLQRELEVGKADPFDSHPSLPERIAALSQVSAKVPGDSRPATDLLDNFQLAETTLLNNGDDRLQPIAWDRTLDQVFAPSWRNMVDGQKEALRGLTVRDLWHQFQSGELKRRIKNPPGRWPTNDGRADFFARVLAGSSLALALRNTGWAFHTVSGDYCEKNEHILEPFELIGQLAVGSMTRERWEAICDTNGIGSLPLLAEKAVGA